MYPRRDSATRRGDSAIFDVVLGGLLIARYDCMQGVVRVSHLLVRGWLACVVAAGCGNPDPATGPDASATPDGSNTSGAGLAVRWAAEPAAIPGDAGSNVTISSLLFRVANLRVIGDAGPGDTRTSIDAIQLAWAADTMPATVGFGDAPSGLYSRVALLADGNQAAYSYEVAGTVKFEGTLTPYAIHDRAPLAISLDTSATLDPGGRSTLTVTVRIDQALQSLDFHKLRQTGSGLVLDTGDPAISGFRDELMKDFQVHADGDH
jgi:hypothetical protein